MQNCFITVCDRSLNLARFPVKCTRLLVESARFLIECVQLQFEFPILLVEGVPLVVELYMNEHVHPTGWFK